MNCKFLFAASLLALATACTPEPVEEPAAVDEIATVPAAESCPDDGPRFAGTGLCVGRSVNYLDQDVDTVWQPREGCSETMNEAMIADGADALLYRAAVCDGVTTRLDVSVGAHSASVLYADPAAAGDVVEGQEVIRLFIADPEDPQAVLRNIMEGLPEEERATCEIRPAGIDVWPADALVIAPTAEARAAMPSDEPIAACGEFGIDEDSTTYWRIKQGYAWFFQLGQDTPDFDPGSITMMHKSDDGIWSQAE